MPLDSYPRMRRDAGTSCGGRISLAAHWVASPTTLAHADCSPRRHRRRCCMCRQAPARRPRQRAVLARRARRHSGPPSGELRQQVPRRQMSRAHFAQQSVAREVGRAEASSEDGQLVNHHVRPGVVHGRAQGVRIVDIDGGHIRAGASQPLPPFRRSCRAGHPMSCVQEHRDQLPSDRTGGSGYEDAHGRDGPISVVTVARQRLTMVAPSPPSPRSPARHSCTNGWLVRCSRTESRNAPVPWPWMTVTRPASAVAAWSI